MIMSWMPIEQALKDGTQYLLGRRYSHSIRHMPEVEEHYNVGFWHCGRPPEFKAGWYSKALLLCDPTHFQEIDRLPD
jgi:hypothetical protein